MVGNREIVLMTQRVAILGSTGSIGRQTLEVIEALGERFCVVGLAAGRNLPLLQEQVARFSPRYVSVERPEDRAAIHAPIVLAGEEGLLTLATAPDIDLVVIATTGHAAIRPTLAAIQAGKAIALANKETIVCAGELIMQAAAEHNVLIRPIDSEHSALWQCLALLRSREELDCAFLTASGGPFRTLPLDQLAYVTVEQALAHPTWKMGAKVTVDSATLMNKGLELIEAHWLFSLPFEQLDVIIHPQSVVHALVRLCDGSTIAQLATPDMRLPIQYALTYPERLPSPYGRLDWSQQYHLEFYAPDPGRFPALELAREAGKRGTTFPTVLSSADEVAVSAFLQGRLRFCDIVPLVADVLARHTPSPGPLSLEHIHEADLWARETAQHLIQTRFASSR